MTATAPQAPGKLGQAVDANVMRGYLGALDSWLVARRSELDTLDEAVRANNAQPLIGDVMLGLQLWQAIQNRFHRLLATWDGGRVLAPQLEQLSSLIWGRLDEPGSAGATGAGGMTLPEACRMSDALTAQLRSRLQLDPLGTEAVGRLRDVRATMERLRDQVGLEPPDRASTSAAKLAELEARLVEINEKANRGGDIGGLLGPLESESARFERDLIVGGVMRRTSGAGGPSEDPLGQLRADLIARGKQLEQMIAQVAPMVASPPVYAIPDVTALGPLPTDVQTRAEYEKRLQRVAVAMDHIDSAWAKALRESQITGHMPPGDSSAVQNPPTPAPEPLPAAATPSSNESDASAEPGPDTSAQATESGTTNTPGTAEEHGTKQTGLTEANEPTAPGADDAVDHADRLIKAVDDLLGDLDADADADLSALLVAARAGVRRWSAARKDS